MRPQSTDTHPDAERVQMELLRKMGQTRRLGLALDLSATTITLARRAIARRHPELSADEQSVLFVEMHYGSELAEGYRRALLERRP